MPIQDILNYLVRGERLSASLAEHLFTEMLAGRCDDAQIGAALAMIQARGVTPEELAGGARAMRASLTPVDTSGLPGVVIDTCGTGGTPKTFNISTIAALVVAAAAPGRIHVAKHGNRSRSGRGSAEVLSTLGVNVDAGTEVQARCLREAGVCFCFAIHHHPAAKHAAPARKSLGFPTMFNLLGPLCNPAGASRQVVGVFGASYVEPMARALSELGCERAVVVHGLDGMDEISTTAPSIVARVEHGELLMEEWDPTQWGIPRAAIVELSADSLDRASVIAREVLAARPGPAFDIVALNAAAALWVAGIVDDIPEGLNAARSALHSRAAEKTLEQLIRVSKSDTKG